ITILDDTYNANPQSMRAAISVLADSKGGRKVAVLGDMLELGPFAPALHSGVGEYLGSVGIDCLVAVGQLAEHIAQGARDAGVPQVICCHTREEAKAVLAQVICPDCTVLLKGSRGMKLEELTAKLLELTAEG
ncbi:MAG: UDP-N-acetylmuramoyl-tripeptide--D-alanyl-D-alanine ligase, partial [Lawsonibacter sp.]|nr:UDP-N-acetylmuramoyl-tripeptide--D-alanyl-D-alanine ligase [Lawsonibacter sp.]